MLAPAERAPPPRRSRGAIRGTARSVASSAAPETAATAAAPRVGTLYTIPVSNYGARVSLVLAWKGVPESEVAVCSPQSLGGLRSPEYLALSPQGKMPLLVLSGAGLGASHLRALFESEVIVAYLMDRLSALGPSLVAPTAEGRACAALATRVHDVYLGPCQGALYKAMEADTRAASIAELAKQLDVLEAVLCPAGPFAAGGERTTADAALFPTFCFYTFILPRVFGWADVFAGRPRLARWWAALCADGEAERVRRGILEGLGKWEADGRWEKLGIAAQVAAGGHRWAY